ncbi:MAG: hypothetical protein JEZ02_20660 [Desulfatibacillum sp.]|nr:hypothetical protein [Desulfatibacillum sp.]
MKSFTKCLMIILLCCTVGGCSGDEEKKSAPPPKAEKQVTTPFDVQIGALNKAKDLSKELEAQQKVNQAQVDKMFEE